QLYPITTPELPLDSSVSKPKQKATLELTPDSSVNNHKRKSTLELTPDSGVNNTNQETTPAFQHPPLTKNDCTNFSTVIFQNPSIILMLLPLLLQLHPRALLGIPFR